MPVQIDCIPPHIDHHDFSRPFCTISLLSEQSIMFGHKLIPLSAGEFVGATCDSFLLPLPTGRAARASCRYEKGHTFALPRALCVMERHDLVLGFLVCVPAAGRMNHQQEGVPGSSCIPAMAAGFNGCDAILCPLLQGPAWC